MPPEDSATQLFIRPIPVGPPEHVLDYAGENVGAGTAQPWDESIPPPGQDGTLLAVVPIPGTGTSLAIVGYAITTSAASPPQRPAEPHPPALADPYPPAPAEPRLSRPRSSGLRLDHGQRRVWADGREIELTYREFELLAFLRAHPATVFTRTDLIERVWHRARRARRPGHRAGQSYCGRARQPGPAQARPVLRPVPGHRIPRRLPVPAASRVSRRLPP